MLYLMEVFFLSLCWRVCAQTNVIDAIGQASWSPDSAGAHTLQQTQPEMFQVYAHGGAMLTQEVGAVMISHGD